MLMLGRPDRRLLQSPQGRCCWSGLKRSGKDGHKTCFRGRMAWSWKLLGLDEQDWVDGSAHLRAQGEEQVCGKDKEGMCCIDIAMGCSGEVLGEKVGPGSRCLSL